MAKLKDIAEDVGVSISMVSRALNPNSDRRVSESLKRKVQEAAERLGFKPNRNAEFLKRGKSPALGVFIPAFSNKLVANLMIGVSRRAEELNFPLNFHFGTTPVDYRANFKRFLETVENNVSSGIITYIYDDISEEEATEMLSGYLTSGGSVITLNTCKRIDGAVRVFHDDFQGGVLAARRLLDRKAEILLCEDSRFSMRTEGFVNEAHAHGVKPVLYTMDSFDRILARVKGGRLGVFACTDASAAGLLSKVSAPGQKSLVIGYDDLEICDYMTPKLTTIRQDFMAEGIRAVEKLVSLIYGHEEADEAIPVSLVVRESA